MSALWNIDVAPVESEDFEHTLSRVVEQTAAWKRSGAGKAEATAMPVVNALMARQSMEQTVEFLTRQAPGWRTSGFRPLPTSVGSPRGN